MDCLVQTKAKIDNTITNLIVLDFASNIYVINEPETYAKQLEFWHERISTDLENALAELEDLDFTA